MKRLLKQLQADGIRFDTIVFAGVGTGSDLAELRSLAAQRLVLLEPNQQQASGLARRLKRNESLLEWALAQVDGEAVLHLFANPKANGLLAPSRLFQFFPNLKQTGQVSVKTVSLATLSRQIELKAGLPNLLVLDVSGLEAQLLNQTPEEVLEQFSHLLLVTTDSELYEGGGSKEDVVGTAGRFGYTESGQEEGLLPPYRSLLFFQDALKLEARRRERQLETQRQEIALLCHQLAEREQQAVHLMHERESLQNELAALAATSRETEDRCAAAADEARKWQELAQGAQRMLEDRRAESEQLGLRISTLMSERDELRSQASNAASDAESLRTRMAAQVDALAQAKRRDQELEELLRASQERSAALETSNSRLSQTRDDQAGRIDVLNQQAQHNAALHSQQIAEVEQSLKRKSEAFERLLSDWLDSQSLCSEFSGRASSLRVELEAATSRRDFLGSELRAREAALDLTGALLQAQAGAMANIEEELARTKNLLSMTETDLAAIRTELEEANRGAAVQKVVQAGIMSDYDLLKKECAQQTSLAVERSAQLKAVQSAKAELDVLVPVLQRQLDQSIQEHETALARIEGEKEGVKRELADERKRLAKAKAELESALQLGERQTRELAARVGELAAARDVSKELEAKHELLVRKHAELGKERDQGAKRAGDLKKQLEGATKAADETRSLLVEREAGIAMLNDAAISRTKDITELQAQLTAATDSAAKLRKQLDSATGDLGKRSDELRLLQSVEADLRKQLDNAVAVTEQAIAARQELESRLAETGQSLHEHQSRVSSLEAKSASAGSSLQASRAKVKQLEDDIQHRELAMTELRSANEELHVRQRLLQDELLKAEAQIELIKDLLLRESSI